MQIFDGNPNGEIDVEYQRGKNKIFKNFTESKRDGRSRL
jgi:hypothetical protein